MSKYNKEEEFATCSKTYRFFIADVNKMLTAGLNPKQVFRLGMLAIENQPQLNSRMAEYETKIARMSKIIENQSRRISELEKEGNL